jgi:hypothetical protein
VSPRLIHPIARRGTEIIRPGGRFEFLPAELSSTGPTVLTAVLRATLKAGLEFDSSIFKTPLTQSLGAGVAAQVFVNIAEFSTNITAPTTATNDTKSIEVPTCNLAVVEGYQFALGAAAGATVAIAGKTWGPTPATTIPVFFTTLQSSCVRSAAPTIATALPAKQETSSPPPPQQTTSSSSSSVNLLHKIFGRADAATTTVTVRSTATFTLQSCLSSGMINCPASLQTFSVYTSPTTVVTVIPVASATLSDAAFFPAAKVSGVSKKAVVDFGKEGNVHEVTGVKGGPPVVYTPPPPPPPPAPPPPPPASTPSGQSGGQATGAGAGANRDDNDVDGGIRSNGQTSGRSNRTVLGLVLGLVLPTVVGLIAGAL